MPKSNEWGKRFCMIDLSYFIQISGNKPSFLLRVMNIFIHETPKDLAELTECYGNSNYQKVKEISHKLKGLFKSYNLEDLLLNTLTLENAAKENVFSEDTDLILKRILEEYEIARIEMISLAEKYKV